MNDKSEIQINPEQAFGHDPVAVRETDHYKDEYVGGFVNQWDALIDWDRRAKSEGDFFINHLKERGVKRVLDVACGTGFHSVRLIEAGFEVVSADGSAEMLHMAFENARQRGHVLRTVQADWRYLNRDVHGEFDAVICLGNSFTHMFNERDRRKALAEFYAALKHDGMLVLDQRNYDSILDDGFDSKHTYYYCGKDITAEPEYVDEGLARFRYTFPDGNVYHLNMFPLRKKYTRRLLHEVGFQQIGTYGDFQETYHDNEPDFFIHVAEKAYVEEIERSPLNTDKEYSATVNTAREYYNSEDADNFYYTIWGGEDIHVGLYESDDEPIFDASRRTVKRLASRLKLDETSRVIDVGAGFGGAARFLAKTYGCDVVALNLSERENDRDREMNREQDLDHLVEVVDASFEDIPFANNEFNAVWSQDAFLHSGNREKVIEEVSRVLRPGGELVFTDPMQADNCPEGVLTPILERIHLDTLGSPKFYQEVCERYGLKLVDYEDLTQQLVNHYSRVLKETEKRDEQLRKVVSPEYIERMKKGLNHWVEGGKKGHLAWGIFHFRKER